MVALVRATAVLDITHGTYSVEDDGLPQPGAISPDGLIHPGQEPENGAAVTTGTFYGPVEVSVEVLDGPPSDDADDWERVQEAELTAAGDKIGVFPLQGDPPDLPELTVEPGNSYHLRVSVRGFAAGRARPQYDDGQPACEFHLVQLWPST